MLALTLTAHLLSQCVEFRGIIGGIMEFEDNYGCLASGTDNYFWEDESFFTQEEMERLIAIMVVNYLENKEGD